MKKQQLLSCELVSYLGSDVCLYVFVLGDPRYSQVTFWLSRVSKSFPGERINWIELQNPHASIHLIRNVYISSGSCQFTPPQSIHFQVQYPYEEYISRI